MGLGLFLRTSVLGQREAPTPTGDALLERIVDLGDAYSRRDPDCLGVWYQGKAGDGRASVLLFPIEEPLELWLGEDRLWCSAKTSTAGPGYHAHVVEFLDLIAEDLGVGW